MPRPVAATLSEVDMLAEFEPGFRFPPVEFRLGRLPRTKDRPPDAILATAWGDMKLAFAAEFKSRATPRVFREAIWQAQQYAAGTSRLPMIVVPYLRPEQLDELERIGVSGLDLCGNGVLIVPGRLCVYRTGNRNRFPESATTRFAYRGATSLVPRVFLCRKNYSGLADIQGEIRRRGADVALSTISKALKRMDEDLIVERREGAIRLLQPDKLLDELAASFRPPKIRRTASCGSESSLAELLGRAPAGVRRALSGRSSIETYAVMGRGRDERPVVYTDSIRRLLKAWGDRVRETARFVDFELQETEEASAYFDARLREGLPFASPIQVYVECRSGDKREQEVAEQVRSLILRELGEADRAKR